MAVNDLPRCGSASGLLEARQNYSLPAKIYITKQRIKEWYEAHDGMVYVAFSGGKDSLVLLHLVREMYPGVPAVFVNTGLEYPEILQLVKTIDNVTWVKPKMSFQKVIERHGYPVISKMQSMAINRYRNAKSESHRHGRLHGFPNGKCGMISKKWQFLIDAPFKISERCCDIMKKRPAYNYEKQTGRKPFIGTMAEESHQRKVHYLKNGCNAFELKHPTSTPMSFWLTSDVWNYINQFNISYSKIYDMGEDRTGCAACMFGVHMEQGENRFQRMKVHHPKLWNAFINGMGLGEVLDYIGIDYGKEKELIT